MLVEPGCEALLDKVYVLVCRCRTRPTRCLLTIWRRVLQGLISVVRPKHPSILPGPCISVFETCDKSSSVACCPNSAPHPAQCGFTTTALTAQLLPLRPCEPPNTRACRRLVSTAAADPKLPRRYASRLAAPPDRPGTASA